MISSDRVFGFDLHRCAKKVVIIDFNRLNWLINRQLSSNIDFNRLIDYMFDDRFRSIRYALRISKSEMAAVLSLFMILIKFVPAREISQNSLPFTSFIDFEQPVTLDSIS